MIGGRSLDGALQLHYENLTMNNRAKLSTAAKLSKVKKKMFLKNSKNSFCNINILWNNLVWSTCIMNVVLMNCQRSFLIKFNCHMNYSPATTYIKLLSICLVSSDVLALAKLMNEQYTAAQAHHFNLKKISFTKLTKIVDYKASIGYWVFYMHPCCIL